MKNRVLIASLLMASLFLAAPGMALADGYGKNHSRKDEQQNYRDYDRVRYGHQDYFYRGGRFYLPGRSGLVSVTAPIGAVVASLPFGSATMVVGGNSYFYLEGSYYRPTSAGYMVCQAPVIAPVLKGQGKHLPGTVMVRPALLNLRVGPGRSFAVRSQVVRGERLNIRGNSNGWYYVETSSGLNGWVLPQFTSTYAAG